MLNTLRPDTVAELLHMCKATRDTVLEQSTVNPFEVRIKIDTDDNTVQYVYLSCDDTTQIEVSDDKPFDDTAFEDFRVPNQEWLDEYNKVSDLNDVPVVLKYDD